MGRLSIFLVVLLAATPARAQSRAAGAQDFERLFARALESDVDAKRAYLVLADCYLQTGQHQEVVSLLKAREPLFGNDLAYAYLLGTALLHADRVEEGQKYIDRIFGAGESAEAHLLT